MAFELDDGSGANCLINGPLVGPATGLVLGSSTSDKVGHYGVTPVAQRAGAAQATSLVGTASSTAVNTDLKAAILEIMNTLAAVGLWKGAA